jgi:hypothetical protein
MNLFSSKKSKHATEIVADLDQIVGKPVAFRLAGKTHYIDPITTQEFYGLANATAELWALKDEAKITADELVDRYYGIVFSVCKTIKRKDIEAMTQAQVTALYSLIMDTVMGRVGHGGVDEKKKRIAQALAS